jgi:hypothetical protein
MYVSTKNLTLQAVDGAVPEGGNPVIRVEGDGWLGDSV